MYAKSKSSSFVYNAAENDVHMYQCEVDHLETQVFIHSILKM